MRYYPLEKRMNLHDGYRKVFKIDQHHLMLLQIDGERHLVESFCPHRAFPLNTSDVSGKYLICPKHQYTFEIASGELVKSTEEPCRNLRVYDIIEEDREVGVLL